MSQETIDKIKKLSESLPAGCYLHSLQKFATGYNSPQAGKNKGTVSVTLRLGLEQIGASTQDLRALSEPYGNKLVPMLLFVEPEVLAPIEDHRSSTAAIKYALEKCDGPFDSMEFLRYWNEGSFDVLRRNWPDIPPEVFRGVDQFFQDPNTAQAEESNVG